MTRYSYYNIFILLPILALGWAGCALTRGTTAEPMDAAESAIGEELEDLRRGVEASYDRERALADRLRDLEEGRAQLLEEMEMLREEFVSIQRQVEGEEVEVWEPPPDSTPVLSRKPFDVLQIYRMAMDDYRNRRYDEALGHPLVVPSIQNSLLYASGAMLVDLLLGLAIAWVIVRSTIRGRALLDALVMLPLAVPGLVLAFGYLALAQEGRAFSFLVGANGNPVILLVIAYAVRRLPYVVRAAVAGLQQSNVTLEEAALSLGATPMRMMRRIALPLLSANLLAGGILAFAFAMLEVSDSLILAQQAEHFPITKAIYALLNTLGNGYELASALGVWAMIFLGISIVGAVLLAGKRGGLFRM